MPPTSFTSSSNAFGSAATTSSDPRFATEKLIGGSSNEVGRGRSEGRMPGEFSLLIRTLNGLCMPMDDGCLKFHTPMKQSIEPVATYTT